MERYLRFVIRHRLLVLVAMAVVTAVAGAVLPRAVVASAPVKLFFGDDPDYARWKERARQFGNDELIIVGLSEPRLFTADKALALRRAVERIERLDDVGHVTSLASADRMRGADGDLLLEKYVDLIASGSATAARARAELLEDELQRGLVISDDGSATLVAVELSVDDNRTAERVPEVVDQIVAAFIAEGFARDELHLGGTAATISACVDLAYFTFQRITPLVVVILLVVTYLLFRRLWPVTITGGVAGLGVLWTMGFAVYLDPEVNILMAMVPGVMMVVAFSDVVHLCSAYLTVLGTGISKEEAILKSGTEVGTACFFTSLTTFFGFASMVFVPTPAMRQLGLVLGFGVAVALLIALTLVPIVFSLMPEPKAWHASSPGRFDLPGVLVRAAQRSSRRHPRAIVALFAVFTISCVVALRWLEVEIDFGARFEEGHPVRVDEAFFTDNFAGTMPLELFVDAPQAGALRDPQTLARVAAFERALEEKPEVDRALSVADLILRLHREMTTADGGSGADVRFPASPELVAQYLLLFEVAGGSGVDRLLDDEARRLRVAVRLAGNGFRKARELGDEAAVLARQYLPSTFEVEALSGAFLFGRFADRILDGQREGLAFAFFVIALIMCLGLRSWRAGIWSMVPNVLPLLALGAYTAVAYDTVDSDTIVVAMIAIGIGVDDTIHFLTRLRYESMRGRSPSDAVDETFTFAGRAIVMTTLILGLGFAPFAASPYYSTRIFGTLLPLTLMVALVADLFFLPALVELGWIRFGGPAQRSTPADAPMPRSAREEA